MARLPLVEIGAWDMPLRPRLIPLAPPRRSPWAVGALVALILAAWLLLGAVLAHAADAPRTVPLADAVQQIVEQGGTQADVDAYLAAQGFASAPGPALPDAIRCELAQAATVDARTLWRFDAGAYAGAGGSRTVELRGLRGASPTLTGNGGTVPLALLRRAADALWLLEPAALGGVVLWTYYAGDNVLAVSKQLRLAGQPFAQFAVGSCVVIAR